MRHDVFPIGARARIKVAGFTLDLARCQLEGEAGELVELRPQAVAVLCHLASAPGKVVTKEELFAAVWPGAVVTDDSLVQAIGDIRRALGPAGHRSVRTVPRRGYVLIPDVEDEDRAPESSPAAAVLGALETQSTQGSAARLQLSRRQLSFAAAGLAACTGGLTGLVLWARRRTEPPGDAPLVGRAPVTVAVLPFESRSVDGSETWIGDALSIGITSSLTRLSGLPVLSTRVAGASTENAHRSEAYAAQALQHHATHLLSGSVESDSTRLRATIQLTLAGSGLVMWSEHYDRPLNELFLLEDEAIQKTVTALQVKLTDGEQAKSRTNPKGNLKAWELATRGYERFETGGPAPLAQARQLFEQALLLDQDYAWARSYLAATCFLESRFGFARDPGASMARALEEAIRAVRTDPDLPDAYSTLGGIRLARREFDQALEAGKRAVQLGPSDAEIHAVLAQTMLAVGEWLQSVDLSRKAIQLTGRHPSWYLVPQSFGYVFLGRFEEGLVAGRRMLDLAESRFQRRAALTAITFAQVEGGRVEDARRTAAELLPLPPGHTAATVASNLLFRDPRHADRVTRAMKIAGL